MKSKKFAKYKENSAKFVLKVTRDNSWRQWVVAPSLSPLVCILLRPKKPVWWNHIVRLEITDRWRDAVFVQVNESTFSYNFLFPWGEGGGEGERVFFASNSPFHQQRSGRCAVWSNLLFKKSSTAVYLAVWLIWATNYSCRQVESLLAICSTN